MSWKKGLRMIRFKFAGYVIAALFLIATGCISDWFYPTITIKNPVNLSFFGKGEVIIVDVEAEDPDGNSLEILFMVNDEGISSTTDYPYRFYWNTKGLDVGDYMLKTKVIDSNGWTDTDSVLVTLGISTPKLYTGDLLQVTLTTATVGASIETDGGAPIIETGFYYSTLPDPVNAGIKSSLVGNQGDYQSTFTGLATNTTYHYTAYARNDKGESYGGEKVFRTLGNEIGVFNDKRDGKVYAWVRIGSQTWMAENLAYLPSVNRPDDGNKYNPRYYVYGYDGEDVAEAKNSEYYQKYGALYNWKAALNSCPEGWHVPSDDEWKTLEKSLGMSDIAISNAGWRGTNEGRMLKSRDGWKDGGNGSNVTDFNAVPAGYRLTSNVFDYESVYANFWAAREYSFTEGWTRYLYYNNTAIYRGTFSKDFGLSVRCIKD